MSDKLEILLQELMESVAAADGGLFSQKMTEILTRDKTYYMALANISSGIIDKEHLQKYAKIVLEEMDK